jgi:hypothetical protein
MDAGVNASTILLLSDTSDMSDACGRDITPYISNLDAITPFISRLQDRLQFSIELSSCSRVYPLFNEYVWYSYQIHENIQLFIVNHYVFFSLIQLERSMDPFVKKIWTVLIYHLY